MSVYYEDEYVQLHHGDCRAIRGWTTADVLVTDPPYGVAWKRGATTWYGKNGAVVPQDIETVAGDHSPEVRDLALDLWGDRPAIVFGSWRVPRPAGVRHRLVWHKQGRNPGPSNAPWFSVDEEIYILGSGFHGKPNPSVYPTTENRATEPGRIGHPTPKPVALMEALIAKCPPGVIADPFAGSGATLIAARNLGRKAIGVELEEKYCELIVKRLSQQAFDFSNLEES
jgi:site-specific DNA-methyltransferase (adenine-specific)